MVNKAMEVAVKSIFINLEKGKIILNIWIIFQIEKLKDHKSEKIKIFQMFENPDQLTEMREKR